MTTSQEIFKLAGSHGRGLIRELGLTGRPAESWLADLHRKNHPVYPYLMVIAMCIPDPEALTRLFSAVWSTFRCEDPEVARRRYTFRSLEDYETALTEFTEDELQELGKVFIEDRYYPSVSEIMAMTNFRGENGYIAPEIFLNLILEDSSVVPSINK